MAERQDASGAEMLTALVAGAEVGLRIGAAAPHRFHHRGLHATSVAGPFTSAMAASRLLRLDAARTINALGLVGSQSSGLLVGLHDGSWVKRLHPGWSVQAGITGALLAQRGFLGPHEVLESPWGLYGVLLHGDEEPYDIDELTSGLGERWLLPDTTYKPYSNGAWNHSSMDAVVALMHEHGINHADIARIDAAVPVECITVVCEPRDAKIHPHTPYHMKFSLPYSVAIVAVLGHADVEDYTDEVHANPDIADLAARIFSTAIPICHRRDSRRASRWRPATDGDSKGTCRRSGAVRVIPCTPRITAPNSAPMHAPAWGKRVPMSCSSRSRTPGSHPGLRTSPG